MTPRLSRKNEYQLDSLQVDGKGESAVPVSRGTPGLPRAPSLG